MLLLCVLIGISDVLNKFSSLDNNTKTHLIIAGHVLRHLRHLPGALPASPGTLHGQMASSYIMSILFLVHPWCGVAQMEHFVNVALSSVVLSRTWHASCGRAERLLPLPLQVATKFHYTKQLKPEKFTHHTTLEVIWTVIPTLIVLAIAVPSLTLIYSLDQHTDRPGESGCAAGVILVSMAMLLERGCCVGEPCKNPAGVC